MKSLLSNYVNNVGVDITIEEKKFNFSDTVRKISNLQISCILKLKIAPIQ
jgi:nucleosome binding factor SPN SPT16 subunit